LPELNTYALAVKIAVAVLIVVVASRAAERASPFLGAMIATLPVSTGPVYVFLAIDHGAAFVAESARVSVASTSAIVAFIAAHAYAARRFATFGSLAFATLAWLATALALQARVLSGGERRLLEISRALVMQPEVLLVDEPSIGLEPRFIDMVFEILDDLQQKEGKTILMVEQNAKKGLEFADLGYVLVSGELALADSGDALLQNPEVGRLFLGG